MDSINLFIKTQITFLNKNVITHELHSKITLIVKSSLTKLNVYLGDLKNIKIVNQSIFYIKESISKIKLICFKFLASNKKFDAAVIEATKNNNLQILQFLLPDNRKISKQALNAAAIEATKNNNLQILQFLLSSDKEIFDIVLAVIIATKNGNLQILQFLLSGNREISKQALDDAVIEAAKNGKLQILQFLLSGDREISNQALDDAVIEAAKNGKLQILQFLLSGDREISKEAINWALTHALYNVHLHDTYNEYLNSNFISNVAYSKPLTIVEFLLSTISIETRKWAEKNCMINTLLNRDSFGTLLIKATGNNCLNTIQFLLSENRDIPKYFISTAVNYAIHNNNLEILHLLLTNLNNFTPEQVYFFPKYVEIAVRNNNLRILMFLLSNGITINEEVLYLSLGLAYHHNHTDIINFFLRDLTLDYRSYLAINFCDKPDLLNSILSSGPISDDAKRTLSNKKIAIN